MSTALAFEATDAVVERVTESSLSQVKRPEMALNPMSLIERALSAGASIEQVEKLIALQERWEANEAKKAFAVAFGHFKAETVLILKNVTVTDGPLKGKKHADLFGVCSAVIPALSKHGLSHSWRLTKDELTWMEVTCTIRHNMGYSESVSMGAAPDTGPGRNAIQARGSAKTYLERYTLLAATGLSATDNDNDANAKGQAMPDEDFVAKRDAIEAARNDDELKKFYNLAIDAAEKVGDKDAIKKFADAKNKQWRALHGGAK